MKTQISDPEKPNENRAVTPVEETSPPKSRSGNTLLTIKLFLGAGSVLAAIWAIDNLVGG